MSYQRYKEARRKMVQSIFDLVTPENRVLTQKAAKELNDLKTRWEDEFPVGTKVEVVRAFGNRQERSLMGEVTAHTIDSDYLPVLVVETHTQTHWIKLCGWSAPAVGFDRDNPLYTIAVGQSQHYYVGRKLCWQPYVWVIYDKNGNVVQSKLGHGLRKG